MAVSSLSVTSLSERTAQTRNTIHSGANDCSGPILFASTRFFGRFAACECDASGALCGGTFRRMVLGASLAKPGQQLHSAFGYAERGPIAVHAFVEYAGVFSQAGRQDHCAADRLER